MTMPSKANLHVIALPSDYEPMQADHEWRVAICDALARYSNDQIQAGGALQKIAENLVELALQGDKDARTEIANRLDGKPTERRESYLHQPIEHLSVQATREWVSQFAEGD